MDTARPDRGGGYRGGPAGRYPHLALWGGMYRLAYAIVDTGVVSGIAYARVARSASPDFVHWQAGVEDPGGGAAGFPYGAAWVAHATGQVLVAAEGVRLPAATTPPAITGI